MYLIETQTKKKRRVFVNFIDEQDFKSISKSNFYFDWKKESEYDIYKLMLEEDILGLMACYTYKRDERIEIKLLSVSKENIGQNKKYDRITGTLIGFACREAIKLFGINGCVSLVPKTRLKQHYVEQYGMIDAGRHVFLEGEQLLKMVKKYYEL